eukprot:TRINITY_DN5248_c0_g2_i1.p1 TRINITY_DN5248_c0_g2~~TRINITY_DN5248_c0_g2_i1.p1  ORF type:complete len:404 (+),score=75.19 TRINITY_DN5248_c0_g2_i1:114-1325(+)
MNFYALFVLSLIFWVAMSYVVQSLWVQWSRTGATPLWQTQFWGFAILFGMSLWSYFQCMLTHPGRVPNQWTERHYDYYEDDNWLLPYEHRKRYCPACSQWKPPRTHHCSVCKQCILRYDHHCPWIDNCVGYYNHKFFLQLVTYLPLTCLWVVIFTYTEGSACTEALFDESQPPLAGGAGSAPTTGAAQLDALLTAGATGVHGPCHHYGFGRYNFVAMFWISIIFAVMLTLFALQAYWLALHNKTTLEDMEPEAASEDHIFDHDPLTNFSSFCGSAWWCWPIPVPVHGRTLEGGTFFQVNGKTRWKQHDQRAQAAMEARHQLSKRMSEEAAALMRGEDIGWTPIGRVCTSSSGAQIPAGGPPRSPAQAESGATASPQDTPSLRHHGICKNIAIYSPAPAEAGSV